MATWTAANVFAIASGLIFAAMALWVGRHGRFRGKHGAFALAGVAFGLGAGITQIAVALYYVPLNEPKPLAFYLLTSSELILMPATMVALWWLLRSTGPVSKGLGVWFWATVASAVAMGGWPYLASLGNPHPMSQVLDAQLMRWWLGPYALVGGLRVGAMAAVGICMGLRFHRIPVAERRDQALMAGALLIYPALFYGGLGFNWYPVDARQISIALWAGTMATVAAIIWLRAMVLTRARGAWMVAALGLASALVGFIVGPLPGAGQVAPAIARIAEITMVSYALLRHDFLGLDARIRFGISKSTVAAVFVAVFFVVSEGAQQFFGNETGNEYYGIAAAGLLVFGIAPLMRFSDRLAEKAVPKTTEAVDNYRESVRIALADGAISQAEQEMLDALAIRLNLSFQDVRKIHLELAP